jgi:hypothetical protein
MKRDLANTYAFMLTSIMKGYFSNSFLYSEDFEGSYEITET